MDIKITHSEQSPFPSSIQVENVGEADLVGESDQELLVLLNCHQDESLREEGVAREVINRVQKLKKKLNLVSTDLVYLCYDVQEVAVKGKDSVLSKFKTFIETAIKSEFNEEKAFTKAHPELGSAVSEDVHLQAVGLKFRLSIYKEMVKCNGAFVNVHLLHPHGNKFASVLVTKDVDLARLAAEVKTVFRFSPRKHLHFLDKQRKEISGEEWQGKTFLYVYLEEHDKFVNEDEKLWETVKAEGINEDQPACKFVNFKVEGKKGTEEAKTFFLENPRGVELLKNGETVEGVLKDVFGGVKVESLQFC